MTKFLNISTDTTLGGTSAADDVVVSQKAIKTYVDNSGGGGGTPLPDQTGNAGKFLTTDGTSASWGDALTNKATGTGSFSINNSTSNYTYRISTVTGNGNYSTFFGYGAGGAYQYATCVGYNASVGGESSVCVGALALAKSYGVSIGRGAGGSYPSNYSVCIGYSCSCVGANSVAIGYNTKGGNSSSHTYAIALGDSAKAQAANAIQIGKGTNTTASSMFVGSNGGSNYQLLDLTTGNIPIARLGATSSDTDKFLKGDGTWATVSGGSSYTPNLFDYKWSDYEIADQSWIKADSFSWQDGTVYSDAYNHLVADISGITASTETVGSYTITYYQATDGHKVVLADQETIVSNIYTESGVAWYYILDTTNTRFKLPRENPAREELLQIIKAKGNGKTIGLTDLTNEFGLQTWNDQWKLSGTTASSGTNAGSYITSTTGIPPLYTTLGISTDTSKSGIIADLTDSTSIYKGKKYLYFYVGQFSQSATEQTAGLNSSLFNGKVDLDGNNATFPHIIEKQDPTSDNDYTWYRKYSDGWVEQGGRTSSVYAASGTTQTLPIEMTDTNYQVMVTQLTPRRDGIATAAAVGGYAYSTTAVYVCARPYSGFSESTYLSWEVRGKYA